MVDFAVSFFMVAFTGGLGILFVCAAAYGALMIVIEIRKLMKLFNIP